MKLREVFVPIFVLFSLVIFCSEMYNKERQKREDLEYFIENLEEVQSLDD